MLGAHPELAEQNYFWGRLQACVLTDPFLTLLLPCTITERPPAGSIPQAGFWLGSANGDHWGGKWGRVNLGVIRVALPAPLCPGLQDLGSSVQSHLPRFGSGFSLLPTSGVPQYRIRHLSNVRMSCIKFPALNMEQFVSLAESDEYRTSWK